MAYVTVGSNVSCQFRGTSKVKSKFLTPNHEKIVNAKRKIIYHSSIHTKIICTQVSQFSMILRKNMVFIPMLHEININIST